MNETVSSEHFGEVVNQYAGYVYTLSYRLLGNRDDAEEASQETFIKAYKNLDRYDETKGLKNWLCTIALNTARDFYRKSRRQKDATGGTPDIEQVADYRDAASTIERRLDIQKILATLDLKYRTVIILFYMEQFGIKEIAQMLKKPENLIKIWLFRARKMMQEQYGESLV